MKSSDPNWRALMAALPDKVGGNTAIMLLVTSSPYWNGSKVTIHAAADIPKIWNEKSIAQLLAYLIDKVAEERQLDATALTLQIADIKMRER
jgi:hypothetical protein